MRDLRRYVFRFWNGTYLFLYNSIVNKLRFRMLETACHETSQEVATSHNLRPIHFPHRIFVSYIHLGSPPLEFWRADAFVSI